MQLPFVERYFKPHVRHGLTSIGRLYQLNYLPATMAPGQDVSFVVAGRDGPYAREYHANAGLDFDHDRQTTIGDLQAEGELYT